MKIVIIEDEPMAVKRLLQLLPTIDDEIEVLDNLDSVKSAVQWFDSNPQPDLAFFDIQLADGLSFEIFKATSITCPVIFTTAYDQYALQAFKVNSIDYLLKPINKEDLGAALDQFKSQNVAPVMDAHTLIDILQQKSKVHKERFIIKVGDHLKTVLTKNIRLIYSENKSTYCLHEGKSLLDFTLDQIEDLIDHHLFFRINRKHIIHIDAMTDMISFSNSRLKIQVKDYEHDDLIVSREKVSLFKKWLDR